MTQLSHAHGPKTVPLLNQTIGDNLRSTVERFGGHDAFVIPHQKVRLTYSEFWQKTSQVALGLLALGIRKGDRVGIWSPNRIEWPIVQYASARIGAILVNVNPSFRAGELEFVINQSGMKALFFAPNFCFTPYEPILDSIRGSCLDLEQAVLFGSEWDAFIEAGKKIPESELAERESALRCNEPINIQYTSGTTGLPKGATLTHRNILNNGYFVGRALGYSEADRVCVPVPFYHCFGMVLGSLACTTHGSCLVVSGASFDPRGVLETVHSERCTSLYGVPTMFRSILEQTDFESYDVTSLRTGVMAGSPCPADLLKDVIERLHMPEVAVGYGMTEMSPIATFTARQDSHEHRVNTVGSTLDHVETKIINPKNGLTLPRGEAGEFCARGYSIMDGYWSDPKATASAIDADGWMHSGDRAVMDEDGYVRIVGRIKDIIIRGGENIAPREVEDVLTTHPAVLDAQIIGVPHPLFGEEVVAWVRLKPGMTARASELRNYCSARIANFKVPRVWKFVEAFPLTVTGKVQKFRMREIAMRELEEVKGELEP